MDTSVISTSHLGIAFSTTDTSHGYVQEPPPNEQRMNLMRAGGALINKRIAVTFFNEYVVVFGGPDSSLYVLNLGPSVAD
jgi:hypothetical protein